MWSRCVDQANESKEKEENVVAKCYDWFEMLLHCQADHAEYFSEFGLDYEESDAINEEER